MATDKDFVVKNGLQVGTTANIAGAVSACSTLAVAGLTTIAANVNVDSGTLFVDATNNRVGVNTASPDVALTVQGSANVSVNLRVGGDLIIAGNTQTVGTTVSTGNNVPTDNTYFLGNTTNRWSIFAKSFTSDGVAAISNTLASGNVTVTGFANVSTTLAVTGAATLSNTLSVTGNTVLSGTANVTGAVALANTLGATGAVTFANTLTVTGLANLNSGINTTFVNASANVTVGANVLVDTTKLFIGNSTANSTHNVTLVQISNSTSTANLSAIDLKIGTSTVNSTVLAAGANVIISTSEVSVGNSTVNTRISATEVLGYSNAFFNVITSNGSFVVGNSTVNTTISGSAVTTNGTLTVLRAATLSNTLGVTGAATFSNNVTISGNLTVTGTTTYVNTTTLNISDNIITLNADLGGAVAPTESAGIEINRGSSANVILQWNETNDVWELTTDGTTYSNIVTAAYSSNADNITSGTLNTARLPSQVNVSTQIYVGANVSLNTTVIAVGNSTVYSNVNRGTITTTGLVTAGNLNTTTANASTSMYVGANVLANVTTVAVGNSTVYSNIAAGTINTTGLVTTGNLNTTTANATTSMNIGASVLINTTAIAVGTTTINSGLTTGSVVSTAMTVRGSSLAAGEGGQIVLGYGNNLASSITTQANNTFNIDVVGGNTGSTPILRIFTVNDDGTTNNIASFANTGRINFGGVAENTETTVKIVGTANVTQLLNASGNLNAPTVNATTLNATTVNATTVNANTTGIHTGNVAATQVNASANVITPTLYGNVVATYVSASANVTVGANVIANLTTIAVGNSTVYSNIAAGTINTTGLVTTGNLNTTTANATTSIYVGANVLANVTTVAVGNSTVYSNIAAGTINTTGLVTTGNLNTTTVNATTINANTTGIHTGNVSATQVNASANVITSTLYGNVVATYVSASANVTVGANVIANLTTVAVGNSTIYSNVAAGTINVTGLATTGNLNTTTVNATSLNATTVTSNLVAVSANVTTTLNGTANLALTGALHTLSGNVNIDAGVFFVDGTNNRVGISNTAPDASLTVTGTANVSGAVRIAGVTTHAANVAMGNNFVTEPTLKAYKEYTESGGVVTTSYTANLALSNIFTLTGTNGSNCVFTFGSPPASGNAQMFTIVFKQPATGSANVTWPASVKWSYGDTPVISTTANARDVFTFLTFDGGTTYLGAYSMANVAS